MYNFTQFNRERYLERRGSNPHCEHRRLASCPQHPAFRSPDYIGFTQKYLNLLNLFKIYWIQHLVLLIFSRYLLIAQSLNALIISNSIQYKCCSPYNFLGNTYMRKVISQSPYFTLSVSQHNSGCMHHKLSWSNKILFFSPLKIKYVV